METIKINNKKKETCKGNALQVVSGGNFFERFVQSQNRVTSQMVPLRKRVSHQTEL